MWDCRSWIGEIQKVEDWPERRSRGDGGSERKCACTRESVGPTFGGRRVRTRTDEQRNRNRGCIGESNFDILRVCLHPSVQRFSRTHREMCDVVRVAAATISNFFSHFYRQDICFRPNTLVGNQENCINIQRLSHRASRILFASFLIVRINYSK